MTGMKLRGANGLSPTASPIASPITTESAKATASSQKVMRKAAGTPRVSNTAGSEANTCDGGLRNIGSTHQRAAISQRPSSSTMTAMRATHGRRRARRPALAAGTGPFPAPPAPQRRPSRALSPRFEHGYERVEDRGDRHDEGDIGEHRRHLHAFGEMNDAVTESGERGDGLAADDGEQRDGKSHAHPGQDDRQHRGQQ